MAVDWEELAKTLGVALGLIEQVVDAIPAEQEEALRAAAPNALVAIGAIVKAVTGQGDLEHVDVAQVREHLDQLRAAISDNDAAADAAVQDKFGGDDS